MGACMLLACALLAADLLSCHEDFNYYYVRRTLINQLDMDTM